MVSNSETPCFLAGVDGVVTTTRGEVYVRDVEISDKEYTDSGWCSDQEIARYAYYWRNIFDNIEDATARHHQRATDYAMYAATTPLIHRTEGRTK